RMVPGLRHQGVVARCLGSPTTASVDALVTNLDHPAFLLILDGVQDPRNLGACMRCADAAGVDAIVVPADNACDITPVVSKVAAGATHSVPYFRVSNLRRTLSALKEQGVWIVGTSDQAESTLWRSDLSGPIAVVLGAEGKGLRRLTQEHCDFLVSIPMLGHVQSLNVSVAAGVVLYEALRQRRAAG
ncbi:MAG: 23S rRNA (guanosine(2251)-2'-O)-methyltransferase RlmB, partial [Thiohalobacterales bacterium]|nr:23S rRNA (guanosine(2251)-2'-O)-methyltransferase RlmB [Thiohalobacterales bacterium]